MPEISDTSMMADQALLDSFSAETTPADAAATDTTDTTDTEEQGLDYHYNMMLPELEQAAPEEILGLIRKILGV